MSTSRSHGSSSRERLRWTQEFHDRFEEAVERLGGPDRATPKGILKAMEIDGLTIYHVKSHLQKYRISKFVPESGKCNSEKRNISENFPNFGAICGAQLKEVMKMQIGLNSSRLSDHHEVQRKLKAKIEAQLRYLERFAEEPKSSKSSVTNARNPFSPAKLPSLGDESESNAIVSDSEPESRERFGARKRSRVDFGDENLQPTYYTNYNQNVALDHEGKMQFHAVAAAIDMSFL